MGWSFKWVSSLENDFNHDLHVSFTPKELQNGTASYNYRTGDPGMPEREGTSVFYKDERGAIFHTYSTYARGLEPLLGTYTILDLVPKGRDEAQRPMAWVRHHDKYEQLPHSSDSCCHAKEAH